MNNRSTVIIKDLGYFAAAHNLPYHDGGCYNLHGHNYKVEVTIGGSLAYESADAQPPYTGMLVDFTHIKQIYKDRIHNIVDHAMIISDVWPQWYETFVRLTRESGGTVVTVDNDGIDVETEYFISVEEAMRTVDKELGKVVHLHIPQTTAECLARWVFEEMQAGLTEFMESRGTLNQKDEPYIAAVRVYETETSWAEVTG